MNKRRELMIALGAGALVAPFGAFAQQSGKVWRVGFLWENEQSINVDRLDAFKLGMSELGYAVGRDYTIEERSANNDFARLPELAAELLSLKVNVLIPAGTPAAVAASKAAREMPILIATVGDPVGSGLAASLRHPGGNVTGLTNSVASDLYTKRLDLLREILPGMRRIGILYNPDNAVSLLGLKQFDDDCEKLGIKSVHGPVRKAQDVADAFKTLRREKAQGLMVAPATSNVASRKSILEQAAKIRLPAVYGLRLFADSGGLISYGADRLDLYRRAATYADKIFKGAKPGDLPIEQPTKFEMVVNLKTAKALGIKIPNSILVRADKVIE